MENKFILESLASDLKRVALGLHRGSDSMAKRFLEEARERKKEIKMDKIAPYIKNLLNNMDKKMNADDALMFSTLIQNYTQHKKF
jgi:t-SNARE complex subunit (syntaxin)